MCAAIFFNSASGSRPCAISRARPSGDDTFATTSSYCFKTSARLSGSIMVEQYVHDSVVIFNVTFSGERAVEQVQTPFLRQTGANCCKPLWTKPRPSPTLNPKRRRLHVGGPKEMKRCTYCGEKYADDVEICPIDRNPFQPVAAQSLETPTLDVQRRGAISPEEQRFWERMTFRQFAILMVRLQAVWLLFYALVDATYLPRYFARVRISSSSALYTQLSFDSFLAILRIILHVAAAVAPIQYAERVLSWLVKDLILKSPPGNSRQPASSMPPSSAV